MFFVHIKMNKVPRKVWKTTVRILYEPWFKVKTKINSTREMNDSCSGTRHMLQIIHEGK